MRTPSCALHLHRTFFVRALWLGDTAHPQFGPLRSLGFSGLSGDLPPVTCEGFLRHRPQWPFSRLLSSLSSTEVKSAVLPEMLPAASPSHLLAPTVGPTRTPSVGSPRNELHPHLVHPPIWSWLLLRPHSATSAALRLPV